MGAINEKALVHAACVERVEERIQRLSADLSAARDSGNNESKSSMGDKYETGREMVQQELNKLNTQLAEAQKQLNALQRIDPEKVYKQVEAGSIVETATGKFFIATSIGQVEIDSNSYFVVSPVSPIAQQMLGLRAGDDFSINGRDSKIISVL